MKNLLLPVTLIALSIPQASYAEDSDGQWYASGSVGLSSVDDQTIQRTIRITTIPVTSPKFSEDIYPGMTTRPTRFRWL